MCVCIGRKHKWVNIASSLLDRSSNAWLLTDNSMNDGYRLPCCQLMVPKVCCTKLPSRRHTMSKTNISSELRCLPLPLAHTSISGSLYIDRDHDQTRRVPRKIKLRSHPVFFFFFSWPWIKKSRVNLQVWPFPTRSLTIFQWHNSGTYTSK